MSSHALQFENPFRVDVGFGVDVGAAGENPFALRGRQHASKEAGVTQWCRAFPLSVVVASASPVAVVRAQGNVPASLRTGNFGSLPHNSIRYRVNAHSGVRVWGNPAALFETNPVRLERLRLEPVKT